MKKFIVPALFAFLFVAASCMNMNGGSEKGGSIRVALPGGRYVYDKNNADKFVVRVIGEAETIEKDAMLGGVIEFTELEAGEYTVVAEARDSANNDELIASGSKDIKVEADKTTECPFTLIVSNCFVAEDGSIVINKTKLEKTALATVIDAATTITGSGSAGVFIADRTVTLSPYSIGKYEVTQKLFEAVMGENPSTNTTDNLTAGETQELRPVETISWYYAVVFCNKLSALIGFDKCYTITSGGTLVGTDSLTLSEVKTACSGWVVSCDLTKNGYRLPTAAEWEFAARGGNQSSDDWKYTYAGCDEDDLGSFAWYKDNSDSISHEVGLKNANGLGLYDMSGNCWEYCWDLTFDGVSSGSVTDPMGGSTSVYRSRPSGSYSDAADKAKVIQRNDDVGTSTYSNNGFRLARSGFPRAK